jgi:hypothetical protein
VSAETYQWISLVLLFIILIAVLFGTFRRS